MGWPFLRVVMAETQQAQGYSEMPPDSSGSAGRPLTQLAIGHFQAALA